MAMTYPVSTHTPALDPFDEMQKAVDIVNSSPHPVNKIAATVFGKDRAGKAFSVSRTNFWPSSILDSFGADAKLEIGNSSGTVHAETACILAAPCTGGTSLCITDPFCPNCAKNIAESGIRTVYIDHKGFHKDFIARRSNAFEDMAMRICEKAGISIYEMWRKERRLIPILQFAASYVPIEECPVEQKPYEGDSGNAARFLESVRVIQDRHYGRKIAVALAKGSDVFHHILVARTCPAIGYSIRADLNEMDNPQGKYSYVLEPVNRLLMNAARRGVKLIDGMIYSSCVPTAREQVNMVGAGVGSLYIGDPEKSRDSHGLEARRILEGAGILSFKAI